MDNTNLIQEFADQLDDKPYFTISELIKLGVFGSSSGANKALKNGLIPFIKVSEKRKVVPRKSVIDFFSKNLQGSTPA